MKTVLKMVTRCKKTKKRNLEVIPGYYSTKGKKKTEWDFIESRLCACQQTVANLKQMLTWGIWRREKGNMNEDKLL